MSAPFGAGCCPFSSNGRPSGAALFSHLVLFDLEQLSGDCFNFDDLFLAYDGELWDLTSICVKVCHKLEAYVWEKVTLYPKFHLHSLTSATFCCVAFTSVSLMCQ